MELFSRQRPPGRLRSDTQLCTDLVEVSVDLVVRAWAQRVIDQGVSAMKVVGRVACRDAAHETNSDGRLEELVRRDPGAKRNLGEHVPPEPWLVEHARRDEHGGRHVVAFEDRDSIDEVVDVAIVKRDRKRRAAPPAASQLPGSERVVEAVDPSQLSQHGHVSVEMLRRDGERPRVVGGDGDAVVGEHPEAARTTTRDSTRDPAQRSCGTSSS